MKLGLEIERWMREQKALSEPIRLMLLSILRDAQEDWAVWQRVRTCTTLDRRRLPRSIGEMPRPLTMVCRGAVLWGAFQGSRCLVKGNYDSNAVVDWIANYIQNPLPLPREFYQVMGRIGAHKRWTRWRKRQCGVKQAD